MFAFVLVLILTWLGMWAFFKFMYPKPPKEIMPQEGDIITPRDCSLCGYPLAEYRGVLETKPQAQITEAQQKQLQALTEEVATLEQQIASYEKQASDKAHQKSLSRQHKKQARATYEQNQKQLFEKKQALKQITTWFFCNYDHQADFHTQQASH